jgi:hypothetical protein
MVNALQNDHNSAVLAVVPVQLTTYHTWHDQHLKNRHLLITWLHKIGTNNNYIIMWVYYHLLCKTIESVTNFLDSKQQIIEHRLTMSGPLIKVIKKLGCEQIC